MRNTLYGGKICTFASPLDPGGASVLWKKLCLALLQGMGQNIHEKIPRDTTTHTHQGPVKYHVRERRPLPSGNKKRNMTVKNPPPVEIRIVYPLGSAALGPVGMAYQNGPSRITRKGGVPMIPTGPPAPTRLNART